MTGKTVLITGCSAGGIGHALAISFQHHGYTVLATARSPKKMSDLASLPNIHLLGLDVIDTNSIAAVVKEVEIRTGGSLDVLINNAGQQYIMPALDVDICTAKALFDVNYWGPLSMIQAFSNMLIQAKGCVVNIGSGAGVVNIPLQSKQTLPRWNKRTCGDLTSSRPVQRIKSRRQYALRNSPVRARTAGCPCHHACCWQCGFAHVCRYQWIASCRAAFQVALQGY